MLGVRSIEHISESDVSLLNYINTKTPGKRSLKTPGRTTLKSRAALQENATYHAGGAMTVGKGTQFHTPFHPAIQARKVAQTVSKPIVVVSRPLGDKTPFPNRQQPPLQTPAPQTAKISKLSLLESHASLMQTPGALLLPSARRKSLRERNNESGGRLSFKTPVSNGNHWDVSDDGIEVDMDENGGEEGEVEIEDTDEIEYMPPKPAEIQYEPSFPMPDHKLLGRTLLRLAHNYTFDDAAEAYCSRDIEDQIDVQDLLKSSNSYEWEKVQLPELGSDDPFLSEDTEKARRLPVSAPKGGTAPARSVTSTQRIPQRPQAAGPSTRSASGPTGSSATKHPAVGGMTLPQSKTNPTPRPATSFGVRPTKTALLRQAANANQSSVYATTGTPGLGPPRSAVPKLTPVAKKAPGVVSTGPRQPVAVKPRNGSVAKVRLNPSLVTKVDGDLWLFKHGGLSTLTNDDLDDFRFNV